LAAIQKNFKGVPFKSRLCFIFGKKKTGVDPSSNVVQLTEAHALHTLFDFSPFGQLPNSTL
jgi:hypothetical protein